MTPRVSVGMPVFNLEATVGRAIDSVLAQTLGDLELVVSDNASTDTTGAICRRYAAADPRVRYTRQPAALDAYANFRYVLAAARAPYFMWLSADDFALPGLLARAAAVLDARPDVVACVPRVEFLEPDGTRRRAPGTFALMGSVEDNLRVYLHDPMDNSRLYGLFRRDALLRAMPATGYVAWDWAVAVGTLARGRHFELDDALLVREANAPDKYMRMIDTAVATPLGRLLPMLRFTRALLFDVRVPPSPRTLYQLFRLNVVYHVMYALYRYPRYGRIVHRVGAVLERAAGALGRGGRRARAS